MKNIIFLTTILIILAGQLKAAYPEKYILSLPRQSQDSKFMIGLKGGLTFVQPLVTQKFNVLNPLDNTIAQSGKKNYKSFIQNVGYQYAFSAIYQFSNSLDIRLEPTFPTYIYKYQTSFFWISNGVNADRIDMSVKHQQTLKYIEIPVTLRYIYGSSKARPFIQGGLYYGYLLNAIKSARREETYTNALGTSTLNSDTETGDATPLYVKSRYGFNAGIGVDYDLTAVHITFDINLNVGINSVINQAARYSIQQYSGGLYDVQDNIRFIIPSVNIGILFPLHKSARSKMKCTLPS
jgi:hypothetical protein